MVKIKFITSSGHSKEVSALEGTTLLEAALNHDIPEIEAYCGGSCSCGTCHLYVEENWIDKLPQPSAEELNTLSFKSESNKASRLACQISLHKLLDGLTVRTPEEQ